MVKHTQTIRQQTTDEFLFNFGRQSEVEPVYSRKSFGKKDILKEDYQKSSKNLPSIF